MARKNVSVRLRFAVLDRDGFRCRYCGHGADEDAILQVDHVVAHANGGHDDIANLVTSCRDCNLGKAAVPLVSDRTRFGSDDCMTQYPTTCGVCGAMLVGTIARRYCSVNCRMRAYRRRLGVKPRGGRRPPSLTLGL